MNVNGVVVALSETLRLQDGDGLLLLVYNAIMDFHFCVLISGALVSYFKKIMVNNYYEFINLREGALVTVSGSTKYLLKTSFKTVYVQIKASMMTEFQISERIKKLIFNPGIRTSIPSRLTSFSKLISYQGIVTNVVDPVSGTYELDRKVILFITVNKFRSSLFPLKKDSKIFASNVHFVYGLQDEKILVCCGLSSLQELSADNQQVEDCVCEDSNFSLRYPFSIFDILWLQNLFTKLDVKFTSLMGLTENIYRWNMEFIHNVVRFISRPWKDLPAKEISLMEEFFSCPHTCLPFSEDILPTGCHVPFLSELFSLNKFIKQSCSKSWEITYSRNEDNNILVGVLFIKNGIFHIADKSGSFPIIFTKNCSSCYNEENILCKFSGVDTALIIALQSFDLITEEIQNDKTPVKISYFKTSQCSLYPLTSFFKANNESSLLTLEDSLKNLSLNFTETQSILNLKERNALSNSFPISLSSSIISADNMPYSSSANHLLGYTSKSNEHKLLIWNNLWTTSSKASDFVYFLVLFFPLKNKFENSSNFSNKNIEKDEHNFYKTGDDVEFADLINKMDAFFLETNVKLAILQLNLKEHNILLLPNHFYSIDCTTESIFMTKNFFQKSESAPVLLKMSSNSSIVHSYDCSDNCFESFSEVLKVYSVKDILCQRVLPDDGFLKVILTDKFAVEGYSMSRMSSKFYEHNRKMSCCLVIKDLLYRDYIHVYLTLNFSMWAGLLPYMELDMYGFNCFCSKKGFLYLKPAPMFSIKVSGYENSYLLDKHSSAVDEKHIFTEDTACLLQLFCDTSMNSSFKLFCFITKIESAEVFLLCKKCHQNSLTGCFCLSSYDVNIRVSACIDDGYKEILSEFHGTAAKKLLQLQEDHWATLASCVKETGLPLEWDSSMADEEVNCYTLLNQVFSIYCSSQFLCRQIFMVCTFSNKGSKGKQMSLFCTDILDYKAGSLARQCYGQMLV